MKLLSYRINDHDSNFTYYDGSKYHYHKFEREHGHKHMVASDELLNQALISLFDVIMSEMDDIAIIHHVYNDLYLPEHKHQPIDHHLAHHYSNYLISDKNPDVSIVIDGMGELNIPWSVIKDNKIIEQGNVVRDGSIGKELTLPRLMLANTQALDNAGKLMGLAAYGKIDMGFRNFISMFDMYHIKDIFKTLENYDISYKGKKIDWLATTMDVLGDVILEFFQDRCKPEDTIFYSGGVAQNVIWNTKLKKHFPNLVIPPHCADDGLSIGGMEVLRRKHNLPPIQLDNFPFSQSDQAPDTTPSIDVIKTTAKHLADGKIVAWYQGHGEIGPRALGNRSILVNPLIENCKDIINKVKNREGFRPFGASVLSKYKDKWFDDLPDNPYMLYVGKPTDKRLKGITHVDGTCRAQTVDSGSFAVLLEEFYKLTGCPILLNTSLNLAGKPIAGYIEDAELLYNSSAIDYLVVGNNIV